ncbi:GrpB family protein [Sphingobacterium yanglingense]|uniref:GrpB-like predicted nucleotidyltransferase (UPF0157 family) n=1 Tax=Sphingobacterium yanglingense TaxID=1437280 RepID=A0A4R6WG68_9SPHI|nr:GrpB family protein [Sphingobacterium yanglingense]TDQ77342.1 GrpB-like predicted nucleotidyltransferase (UPF0157 family) [Sphingobacterium yanglingense]
MKLPFESYNPAWKTMFEGLKEELSEMLLVLSPRIEHIGSTSVDGLSAKPIIDIMIGVSDYRDLDKVPILLNNGSYVYYEKYNEDMPYRRFFVRLTANAKELGLMEVIGKEDDIPEQMHDHSLRMAHVHVIPTDSEHWLRHIAFRDYLRAHPAIVQEYQTLKERLTQQEWKDGNDYNAGKDVFLKREEQNALRWYKESEE